MKYIRMATIALVAILILCASIHGADTIELPFDYFAGRWVNGHYLHGNYYLQKDRYPRYSWSYLLTSDPFRFSVDRFETNLLYKYQNHEFLSAPMSLDYRPFDHWQLGVHGLVYRYVNRNNESELTNPDYEAFRSKKLAFNITSYWQRHTEMSVSDRAAPYAYRVQPILTKGNVTISNNWAFELFQSSSHRTSIATPDNDLDVYIGATGDALIYTFGDLYASNSSGSGADWDVHNEAVWGVTDDLNVTVEANATGYNRKRVTSAVGRSSRSYPPELDWSQFRYNHYLVSILRFFPEFAVSLVSSYAAPFYLSGSVSRCYTYSRIRSTSSDGDSSGVVLWFDYPTTTTWEPDSVKFSVSIDYLDRGHFDETTLLDDYSDFYHRMLFDGQSQVSLDVSYDRDFRYNTRDHVSVDLSVAHGMSNRAEVGASTSYNWRKSRRYNRNVAATENLSVEFSLRYRSYDYEPNAGPGWHQDTHFDWLYGPTLAAGQTYLSMTLRPYATRSRRPVYRDFMAFDLTRRDPVDWLETDLQVGLGRGLSVTADDLLQWDISRGVILQNSYSLQLEGRILQRFLLTAGFSQTFINHIDKKDTFSDPKFEINIHGLL